CDRKKERLQPVKTQIRNDHFSISRLCSVDAPAVVWDTQQRKNKGRMSDGQSDNSGLVGTQARVGWYAGREGSSRSAGADRMGTFGWRFRSLSQSACAGGNLTGIGRCCRG